MHCLGFVEQREKWSLVAVCLSVNSYRSKDAFPPVFKGPCGSLKCRPLVVDSSQSLSLF